MLFLLNHLFVVIGNNSERVNISVDYVPLDVLWDVLPELSSFDLISIRIHVSTSWEPSDTQFFGILHWGTIRWSVHCRLIFTLFNYSFHGDWILWDSIVLHYYHSLFKCLIFDARSHHSSLNPINGWSMLHILKTRSWISLIDGSCLSLLGFWVSLCLSLILCFDQSL